MRVLVTGGSGFVGRHLAPLFCEAGHEVLTASNQGSTDFQLDLTDLGAVRDLVAHTAPQAIIHLAGVSSVASGWQDPVRTYRINVLGSAHLLEATRQSAPRTRFLSVGSGEEYGTAGGVSPPWNEQTPCHPVNAYGTSKLAQGHMALHFHRQYQVDALHVRAFNHLGAGQATGIVATDIASQLAAMERGTVPPRLRVGNLDVRRDFLDVRDVARAYSLLLERGQAGRVYNLASGAGTPLQTLLEGLLAAASVAVEVESDPGKFRPADVSVAYGDASRLRQDTGWAPCHSLTETLAWVMEDWRGRAGTSVP